MGKIVSVMNIKGGVTKTTTCAHLAHQLHLLGHKVAVIDTDNQQSFIRFYNKRMDLVEDGADLLEYPTVISMSEKSAGKTAQNMAKDYDFVLIDTAGAFTSIEARAAMVSDLAIVPLTPSEADLEITEEMFEEIQMLQEKYDMPLAAGVLLTRFKGYTKISREIAANAKEYGLPMFNAKVPEAVGYVDAFGAGMTIYDYQALATAKRDKETLEKLSLAIKHLAHDVVEVTADEEVQA